MDNNIDVTIDNIGHICRRIRRLSKRSQESVALELGVATSTVERIENGKVEPSFTSLIKMMTVYDYKINLQKQNNPLP
ncbi:helix-turn-helix domain-containing protein [Endozoicomonas lisbonensis]|uniref:Transcriptional regulator with XRE-family HTH domain n=1 Tax=Endozoicomonas lisbonensis TaxID=3120522 RepID=A0ABV2SAM7_9GAMM